MGIRVSGEEFDPIADWDGVWPLRIEKRPEFAVVLSIVLAAVGPMPLTVLWVIGLLTGLRVPIPLAWRLGWAAACLLPAIALLLSREDIVLTEDGVTRKKRGLFGRREWHEPRSAYDGLRVTRDLVDRDDALRVAHRILLWHGSKRSRSIVLYRSYSEEGFWTKQREYAEMLGLPRSFPSGARAMPGSGMSPSGPGASLPQGKPPRTLRVTIEGRRICLRASTLEDNQGGSGRQGLLQGPDPGRLRSGGCAHLPAGETPRTAAALAPDGTFPRHLSASQLELRAPRKPLLLQRAARRGQPMACRGCVCEECEMLQPVAVSER